MAVIISLLTQLPAADHRCYLEKDVVTQASEEEIVEGSKLIATFLKEWASEIDGGDAVMKEAGSAEEEIVRLKQYFERWKPQIQANRWCENLLSSL